MLSDLTAFVIANWLPLIGATLSLVWVYLEYRASMWLWPVGIVLPLFYIAISWEARFIGNIAVNVYYLITSIVGWVLWLRGRGDGDKPIGRVSRRAVLMALCALPLVYWGVYALVSEQSSLPWADATSTATSVVGMIFLGRKWLEHWLCWIVANATGAILFYHSYDYISTCVFVINFGMSFAGYRHWLRLYRQQAQPSPLAS